MSADPRLPEPVQPILNEYMRLAEKQLGRLIDSFYVVGSIALDEFYERCSDIDFLAFLNRKVTAVEFEHLRTIHQAMEKTHPRWRMSGSYIQSKEMGKQPAAIAPYPHFQDGVLHPNANNGINWVTWWELKNCGIPVVGTEPQNLPFLIDWTHLLREMSENLNSYWCSWTRQPRRIILLYSDWGIQWAVLGVLRQFYTFRENAITTKVRAGQYALGCLPREWHPIVQEAIDIRQGNRRCSYRFRAGRTLEAVRFLKYIISTCNAAFRP